MPYDEYRVTRRRCFILKAYCCSCVGREKTVTGNNLNLLLSGLGIGHILTFLEMTFQRLEFPSFSLSDHIFIVSCVALLMTPTRNVLLLLPSLDLRTKSTFALLTLHFNSH